MRWVSSLPLAFIVLSGSGDAYSRFSAAAALKSTQGRADASDRRKSRALKQLARHVDKNTGACDLCGGQQQWLLVLAKSAAASRPTTEILNSLPGYHLMSEGHSVTDTLRELFGVATQINERNLISDPAWKANPISEKHLLCSLQSFARELIVGTFEESRTSVIGFGEVRNATDKNGTQLDFVTKLFPCGRFILQGDEQMGLDMEPTMQLIQGKPEESQSWQEKFFRNHTASSFVVPEEYGAAHFNKVLTWLGVSGCHFQEVAQTTQPQEVTSADGVRLAQTSRTRVAGNCITPKWS